MSILAYNKKRRFSKTPEPKGTRVRQSKGKPLHFVVHKHDARRLHYDIRLELDGVLKSWAVPKGPSLNPDEKRLAIMTEDHPLSYADFEGTIPEGQYGAGDVIVWDSGVYASDKTGDPKESRKHIKRGLRRGECSFVLLGQKLKGKFTLVKLQGDRDDNAWLLIKANDEYAVRDDVTKEVRSVITGEVLPRDAKHQSIRKLKKRPPRKTKGRKALTKRGDDPMPHRISPMLAKLAEEPFDRKGWLFEVKWDGYRAVSLLRQGDVRLYSRNGISFNKKYAPIVDALRELTHTCVLDGEIIALKDGRPDFHALQEYEETNAPLRYVLFDLLYLDGEDLRDSPLRERKRLLYEILPNGEILIFSEHVEHDGKAFFKSIVQNKIEGMIAKDGSSPYREGTRSDAWLKVKNLKRQEAIIVGFTKPRGSRKGFGALVLAAYESGHLRYIGHSGGGFTDTELRALHQKLLRIRRKTSPLSEKIPIRSPITWVTPRYVCEVTFTEWTQSGRMRHPVYVGIRTDKKPHEVFRELPNVHKGDPPSESSSMVKITNRGKVFWPKEGYTKGDVIEYYDRIADVLLPYLKDRAQNLNRHPNGIAGKNFFQKNVTARLPSYVETVRIWSESNQAFIRYIVCNNRETLLYLANLGCIELNPWNSRAHALHKPDYLILDLDPNGRPFSDLIEVAKEVRSVLEIADATSHIKTSGKSGLHVVVPCGGRYSYDDVRAFAELTMRFVQRRMPHITSLERSPKNRKGKIYLDYLQNRFGQTLASAYSLRPYPGATVSTPLDWREVRRGLDPGAFTIKTIWKRLEKYGDLWSETQTGSIDLHEAINRFEKHKDKL